LLLLLLLLLLLIIWFFLVFICIFKAFALTQLTTPSNL